MIETLGPDRAVAADTHVRRRSPRRLRSRVPAPISARGPITAPGIDRHAALQARGRMHQRAGGDALRLEQRGRPQRLRKQRAGHLRRRPDRARARAARLTREGTQCGKALRGQAGSGLAVAAACSAYFGLSRKHEIVGRGAIERRDAGDAPIEVGAGRGAAPVSAAISRSERPRPPLERRTARSCDPCPVPDRPPTGQKVVPPPKRNICVRS